MKFVLFVEGETEKKALPAFFRRWLNPKLSQPIGIQVVKFEGWPELVKDAPTKARMYLQQDDVVAVIALLDLYGPTFYPDGRPGADERFEWAKKQLENKVGETRFRQFFAVHEVEAWLLSNPSIFPHEVRRAVEHKSLRPETVNFDEPPSQFLKNVYKQHTGRTYKKVTHGTDLFDKLDPDKAYSRCPHLKQMLDEMLALAFQVANRSQPLEYGDVAAGNPTTSRVADLAALPPLCHPPVLTCKGR